MIVALPGHFSLTPFFFVENVFFFFFTFLHWFYIIDVPSSGKAPGPDALPAESYKAGGPTVAEKLTELFHIMWRK